MEASPAPNNRSSSAERRKRPRPVLSCLECRRKKLKCDRLLPCDRCQKSRLSCAYSDEQEPTGRGSSVIESRDESVRPRKRARQIPLEALHSQSYNIQSTPVGIIEDLQARVTALEQAAQANGLSQSHNPADEQHGFATSAPEPHLPLSRARAHGKSLGLMANFDEARTFMQKLLRPSDDPDIQSISNQLKTLQSMVRAPRRSISRPQPQAIEAEMIALLPSKEMCSQLLEVYFENFEHCLRILHRPSFLAEYESFWSFREGGNFVGNTKNNDNPTFVPRLLATLLVACTANIAPICKEARLAGRSERASAYELLDSWSRGLKSRDKTSLHALQVGTLRMLVHHERPLSAEETWSNSGTLLRLAMAGSLHLEPDPKGSLLDCEQKRRLFATLLEMELASSVMCGMPTMLTADDFTCRPPSNFNDDEISEDIAEIPSSRSTDVWTDSLCQFVLASSLRQRLEAYRLVTKAGSGIKYEDIIQHARQLECILQNLPAPLRFASTSDDAARVMGRLYARIHLDMAIRRTMIALYTPFAVLSVEKDPYKEARVGYVQSCLIVSCYEGLFDPAFSETMNHGDPAAYWDLFYQDFKRELLRSALGICLEIKWMRYMGFDTDPPGATPTEIDPHNYYDPKLPTKLWKLPAWTITALTKAIEDTLDPMVRRVGRAGSDLKDLGCIAIVYHSIKDNGDTTSRDAAMKAGLSELIASCQKHVDQQRQDLVGSPLNGDTSIFQADTSQYLTPEFNFNFDDLWGTNITFDDTTAMTLMNEDAVWSVQY